MKDMRFYRQVMSIVIYELVSNIRVDMLLASNNYWVIERINSTSCVTDEKFVLNIQNMNDGNLMKMSYSSTQLIS